MRRKLFTLAAGRSAVVLFAATGWVRFSSGPNRHYAWWGISVDDVVGEFVFDSGLWLPGLALIGLVVSLVGRSLSRHGGRFPAGLCRRCGYDLRATPERCPECGA